MSTRTPTWDSELLASHSGWMRRLARGLVRDRALAEDLAQETWEAAMLHPPRERVTARGWLRRVLQNRLRNHARADSRRRVREEAAADSTGPATPEEVAGQLELQRRITALVQALPEPARQVLHLRYFEDREPTEIARLLRIPAGTVRWRLKTTLDELRRRLDEEHGGDRRRWLALLPLPPLALPRSRVPVPVAVLAATLMVASAVVLRRAPPVPTTPTPPRAVRRVLTASPVFSPRAAPGGDLGFCPEAAAVRDELLVREGESLMSERLADEFARSDPNPTAEARFQGVLHLVLDRCEYDLQCRGRICRAQVLVPLVPGPPQDFTRCFTPPTVQNVEFVPLEYLDRRRPASVNVGTPVRDPLSGESFDRIDLHYRLATPTGEPTTDPLPRAGGSLKPGRHRQWPPLPAGRSAACRAEVASRQARLEAALARGDQAIAAEELFAADDPNPGLVPEVVRELARLTAFPEQAVAVECRGRICKATPRDRSDPAMKVAWRCEQLAGQERCLPDPQGQGWFNRLDRLARGSAIIARAELERSAFATPGDPASAYLRIRAEADRGKADPSVVVCQLARALDAAGTMRDCERRRPAATGTLQVKLTVPGPGSASDRHVAVDAAGSLAGSPLGGCLIESLRAAAALPIPETRNDLVYELSLRPPQTMSGWLRRCQQ
jgi:RNA polymerase sigma-70 factor (ECF subfamily)